MMKAAILLFATLLRIFSPGETNGPAATVQLGKTTIVGKPIPPSNLEFFGGIPYAEPAVGRLLIDSPILKTSLSEETFDASSFGPSCLQPPSPFITNASGNCLSLNIFRPAGLTEKSKLPVLAFIHGSGFLSGGSSLINGQEILARSVARGTPLIFVTLNYRLGPIGWPSGELAAKQGRLNLGLQDQLTALQWIQDNIGVFGGDKHQVTASGGSAGAVSLSIMYQNGHLNGLVRGLILQSGSPGVFAVAKPSRGQANWDNFVAAVPLCSNAEDVFACLQSARNDAIRKAIFTALTKANGKLPWTPVSAGAIAKLKNKNPEKIPFMIGTVLDEGTLFPSIDVSTDDAVFTSIFSDWSDHTEDGDKALTEKINEMLRIYPNQPELGSPFNTGNETFGLDSQFKRLSAIIGDIMFQAPSRKFLRYLEKKGISAYSYIFTGPRFSFESELNPEYTGISHGMDNLYLFGEFTGGSLQNGTEAEKKLSRIILDYWISFTHNLEPNDDKGENRAKWVRWLSDTQQVLQQDVSGVKCIPDVARKDQIHWLLDNSEFFHH